jgi:sphingomyelin phosphodiesterase acid-like 3
VSSYADVIKAQFFGHVHSVEFRVPVDLADDDDALQQVPLFVTGSVSPLFGNNPSFMVWEYDAETYEVVDFIVHGTNISNTAPQLAWKPLFQARKAYNIESLSSTALEELALRMQTDPALLEDYYWNMKAQSYRLPPCDHAACRAQILCTMKWWSTRGEYLACVNSVRFSYSVMTRIGTSAGAPMPVSHVAMAIGGTVVASAVIIAVVVVVLFGLKYSGIIKSAAARERDYEDVFPML